MYGESGGAYGVRGGLQRNPSRGRLWWRGEELRRNKGRWEGYGFGGWRQGGFRSFSDRKVCNYHSFRYGRRPTPREGEGREGRQIFKHNTESKGEEGEGWSVVMGRRRRRVDSQRHSTVDIAKRSLYARDLLSIFGEYGEVQDVVIPPRRNKGV